MTRFEKCWSIYTGKGSFLLAQAIFDQNLFPYKYPNIIESSHLSYVFAYEDGTECSETSAYKNVGVFIRGKVPSYWLRLFSIQTFSRINTPTLSNPVIFHTYPPMKME